MSAFANLLANPDAIHPAILQSNAEQMFGAKIRDSGLHRRCPSEQIPSGMYVVIGNATYSPLELALLDEIASRCALRPPDARIEVFSVLECKTMKDFQKYLPGIKKQVYQTPVVGVWNDTKLSACSTGLAECRKLLARIGILGCDCRTD